MKDSIEKLIEDANAKQQFWFEASNNPTALEITSKTRKEALILANYFEGKYDGLCDALRICTPM